MALGAALWPTVVLDPSWDYFPLDLLRYQDEGAPGAASEPLPSRFILGITLGDPHRLPCDRPRCEFPAFGWPIFDDCHLLRFKIHYFRFTVAPVAGPAENSRVPFRPHARGENDTSPEGLGSISSQGSINKRGLLLLDLLPRRRSSDWKR